MPEVDVQTVAKQIVLEGIAEATNMDKALDIIFDNYIRHTIRGHNNITNYYVEDGTAIQDTSTVDPLTVTVQGWMADLVYSMDPRIEKILTYIVQSANIPILGGFISTGLTSVLYVVNLIYEQVLSLIETYKKYSQLLKGTQGAKANSGYKLPFITFDENKKLGYQTAVLENLRVARLPVDVVLPRIGVFHNMYVEDYEWDQDKAYYQAKITITFKQLRTTETILTKLSNATVTHREAESR